jgi:peptidoglycan-associated lipoprotein
VNVSGAPGLIVTARAGTEGRFVRLAEDPARPGVYSGRISLSGLAPGDYDIIAEAQDPSGTTEQLSSATRLRVVASLKQLALDELNSSLRPVYFGTSLHSLTPESLQILASNAEILGASGEFEVSVEGHADESGSEDQNRWLGLWRAKVVKDSLRSLGLSPEKLQLSSFGSTRPAETGAEETSLARNRRVELIASYVVEATSPEPPAPASTEMISGEPSMAPEAQASSSTGQPGGSTQPSAVKSPRQMALDAINARLRPIYFDSSRHSLSPESLQSLVSNAEILSAAGDFKASVEGHSDESGSEDQNRWLGLWRAKIVKDSLRELGILPTKLRLVSLGSTHPVQAGSDETAQDRNRRVEIIVQSLP